MLRVIPCLKMNKQTSIGSSELLEFVSFFCFFGDKVSLHISGRLELTYVAQLCGLELNGTPPASVSGMLGLQTCTSTPSSENFIFVFIFKGWGRGLVS